MGSDIDYWTLESGDRAVRALWAFHGGGPMELRAVTVRHGISILLQGFYLAGESLSWVQTENQLG
jgi:hypothetical protein